MIVTVRRLGKATLLVRAVDGILGTHRPVMILGGLVDVAFGINPERKSLESVTRPLTEASS